MERADDEERSHVPLNLQRADHDDMETQPLLPTHSSSEQQAGAQSIQLSYDQARELLKVLDNTRYVLDAFVTQVQNTSVVTTNNRRSWWSQHCFPVHRRHIARYIFFITAVLQAVNLLVVSLLDIKPKKEDENLMFGTGIFMIILQVINLFFIIMVSMRLVRQLYKHRVSILLLAQSYLATLLLFAGIYTLTYRMKAKSWKFIEEQLEQDPILVIELYSKFLFFSISTATLCGSDNVLPKEWYNCLFTSIQMLMSFVYFASILGQTLSQDTKYWLGVSRPTQGSGARASGAASQLRHSYGSRTNSQRDSQPDSQDNVAVSIESIQCVSNGHISSA